MEVKKCHGDHDIRPLLVRLLFQNFRCGMRVVVCEANVCQGVIDKVGILIDRDKDLVLSRLTI